MAQERTTNGSLKIEALLFLRRAMTDNAPEVFQPHAQAIAKALFAAVKERYYKVIWRVKAFAECRPARMSTEAQSTDCCGICLDTAEPASDVIFDPITVPVGTLLGICTRKE